MKYAACLAILVFAVGLSLAADMPAEALTGTMQSIDGKDVDLSTYKGKVVLVVNVASRCGFTRHYKGLQKLYETYAKSGLVVLGFPCNQFGRQEPGTDAQIQAFCTKRFAVTFPMFSKIEVNGQGAAPLYRYLTSDRVPIRDRGRVKWNFEKFLIGRDGKVIARFRTRVEPSAAALVKAIEEALAVTVKESAEEKE
jgi:glutathione peroxidase